MSDIEHRLLARLTEPSEIAIAWDAGLRADCFEEPLSQSIFDWIITYWLDNQMTMAPTKLAIETQWPGFSVMEDVDEATSWMVGHLRKRFAINQIQEMLRLAASSHQEDPESTLRTLYTEAYTASEAIAPRLARSDMSNDDEREREYLIAKDNPSNGLTLGIPELDDQLGGGIQPGELAVVGGFPKVGKSMFLCNAAAALRKAGGTPILFTLEMSVREMERRIDALYSGVSYNRLLHRKLSVREKQDWDDARCLLRESGPIHIESPEQGDRTVINLVNRARQVGADVMLIDQLSFVDPPRRTRDLKEHHGLVMKTLKDEISRPNKEIPALMAVQLNRDSVNEEVSLKNYANATEVEQFCDHALGLTRTKDEEICHLMKVHILGSRRASRKTFLLHWELTDASKISVMKKEMS